MVRRRFYGLKREGAEEKSQTRGESICCIGGASIGTGVSVPHSLKIKTDPFSQEKIAACWAMTKGIGSLPRHRRNMRDLFQRGGWMDGSFESGETDCWVLGFLCPVTTN
jgi:hypothetical protein